jgi:hypothetical protein
LPHKTLGKSFYEQKLREGMILLWGEKNVLRAICGQPRTNVLYLKKKIIYRKESKSLRQSKLLRKMKEYHANITNTDQ